MVLLLWMFLYKLIIIKYQRFSDLSFHYASSSSFSISIKVPFPPFNFRVPRFSHLSSILAPWCTRNKAHRSELLYVWWDPTYRRTEVPFAASPAVSFAYLQKTALYSVLAKSISSLLLLSRCSISVVLLIVLWWPLLKGFRFHAKPC